jgi:short-subunit dehydrogenase
VLVKSSSALFVGNSDGIGLATTHRLLDAGWNIRGVSRSESSISNPRYRHRVMDVRSADYPGLLDELLRQSPVDLCIYFVGIGELLDPTHMAAEPDIFAVNLTGMVTTAAAVIPRMVAQGHGHFMGLSSLADELLSAEAPSYHASKAGFSNYLEGLALALKPRGVRVTNVRFGFVDTKMAKGDVRPLMMPVAKAVDHLETCIRRKPVRYTAPRAAIPLVKFRKILMKMGI